MIDVDFWGQVLDRAGGDLCMKTQKTSTVLHFAWTVLGISALPAWFVPKTGVYVYR